MYMYKLGLQYYYGWGFWSVIKWESNPTRCTVVGDYVHDDFGNLVRV